MTDAATLGSWVDSYVRAWQSNDPADVAALFAVDAQYFTEPYGDPWVGREAIAQGWIARGDAPGSFTFQWRPVSVTEDVQVVQATTRYSNRAYSNLWVIRLNPEGLCREFTEYWMEHPSSSGLS